MEDRYVEQFELLLDVLPVVMLEERFALKVVISSARLSFSRS